MSELGPCRSCGATVRWVIMHPSTKCNPLDAKPSDTGNIRIETGRPDTGHVVKKEDRAAYAGHLHVSHFSTCPQSNAWRRGS